MARILIQLEETYNNQDIVLSQEILNQIELIISQAKEARASKLQAESSKVESIRSTHKCLEELFNSPTGLTKSELLSASDSTNLSSIIIKIQNHLKKDNKYTIKKRQKDKTILYYLQPIIED